MKKIFTLLMASLGTIMASAADFTEEIIVSVNGESSQQNCSFTITDNGDTYDLTMKNFLLESEDGPMGVGTVEVKGIKPQYSGKTVILQTTQTIQIVPGDDPSVAFWMATILPPVPVELKAAINGDHLRSYIYIDLMASLQQIVEVSIGGGYQLKNTGFEAWHATQGSYEEPNGWHSFESASGSLAAMAGHHITKSDDAHGGVASARLYATSIFGIVANGTMTTGRMNAGSMSATDPNNNAYMDMSLSDRDGNGDPFYTPLIARPDSVVFWAKFRQGKANAQHPYATMSAVITDGTYYQDPADKEYSNVVGQAKNNTIATTGDEWKRIVAPFSYNDNGVEPKAILLTLSTNADAGQGSANDELLVDDIELVYNARLASLSVKGRQIPNFDPNTQEYSLKVEELIGADDLEAKADGVAAYVTKQVEVVDGKYLCTVEVFSADMSKATQYVLNIESTALTETLAVSNVEARQQQPAAYYTLDGRQARSLKPGNIYVRRLADGTTQKITK